MLQRIITYYAWTARAWQAGRLKFRVEKRIALAGSRLQPVQAGRIVNVGLNTRIADLHLVDEEVQLGETRPPAAVAAKGPKRREKVR